MSDHLTRDEAIDGVGRAYVQLAEPAKGILKSWKPSEQVERTVAGRTMWTTLDERCVIALDSGGDIEVPITNVQLVPKVS